MGVASETESPRLRRERETVEAMIELYCRAQHLTPVGLCDECAELADYARARLEHCRYGDEKPTCANCPVHCYKPAMRERIRAVMRYAGPRMLLRHPVMAIRHLLDGRRAPP